MPCGLRCARIPWHGRGRLRVGLVDRGQDVLLEVSKGFGLLGRVDAHPVGPAVRVTLAVCDFPAASVQRTLMVSPGCLLSSTDLRVSAVGTGTGTGRSSAAQRRVGPVGSKAKPVRTAEGDLAADRRPHPSTAHTAPKTWCASHSAGWATAQPDPDRRKR